MCRDGRVVWVLILILVLGLIGPAGAGGDTFPDDDGSVHEANIELIAEAEITLGCGGGLFCPDDPARPNGLVRGQGAWIRR